MRRPSRLVAATAVLAFGLSGCFAQPRTLVAFSTYDVSGSSLPELFDAVQVHGPRIPGIESAAFAAVAPEFTHSFRYVTTSEGCRYNPNGAVELRTDVRLPNWRQREDTTDELGGQWDAITAFAVRHELVHVAIYRQFAGRMQTLFRTLSAPTCEELQTLLDREIGRLWEEQSRSHRLFDHLDRIRFRRFLLELGYVAT